MLVAKDHAGGGRSLILQKYDFCTKKTQTLHRTDSYVSVRNKNCSRHDVFSPPIQIQRPFSPENCPCRNSTKKILEKRLLEAGLYMIFTTGAKFRQPKSEEKKMRQQRHQNPRKKKMRPQRHPTPFKKEQK